MSFIFLEKFENASQMQENYYWKKKVILKINKKCRAKFILNKNRMFNEFLNLISLSEI